MHTRISLRNPVKAVTVFSSKGAVETQEDYVAINREKRVYAVADGFGGAIPGAEASKMVCRSVLEFLEKEAGDGDATLPFVLRKYYSLAGNILFNAMIHANRRLTGLNRERNVHEKGGASLVAGYLDGDLLALANVGSCSAVLIREGEAIPLVVPRTYGRLCDPFKNEISFAQTAPLMALGMTEDLEPEIVEYRVKGGDWVLLKSPGIQEAVISNLAILQHKSGSARESADEARELLESLKHPLNSSVSLMIL